MFTGACSPPEKLSPNALVPRSYYVLCMIVKLTYWHNLWICAAGSTIQVLVSEKKYNFNKLQ